MTLDELAQRASTPNGDIDSFPGGQSLAVGDCVTFGADAQWHKYDPASDTNHLVGFCQSKSDVGVPCAVRVSGVTLVTCNGGCSIQDELMPSAGGSVGQVERWTPGNVSCGFALQGISGGAQGLMLIHHERR